LFSLVVPHFPTARPLGADDSDRSHVPYFHCYYLAEPLLFYFQLAKIFTCLHKGSAALIDRHKGPATLEPIVFRNFWSSQSARPGVAVPSVVRALSHIALKQGELLDLFVPVDEQEIAIEPFEQTPEQQIANFSIYTRHLVEGIETGAVTLNEDAAAIKAKVIKPYREYKKNLQQYEQALVSARGREHTIALATRNSLKRLQQVLRLRDEDIEPIEACTLSGTLPSFNKGLEKSAAHNSVLPYRNSKLLLKAGIAATVMALIGGSIYGLVQRSSYARSKSEFVPAASSRVFSGTK
jgi:phosphate transport system substrate-binding protein